MGIGFYSIENNLETLKPIEIRKITSSYETINYENKETNFIKIALFAKTPINKETIEIQWSEKGKEEIQNDKIIIEYHYHVKINPPNCESFEKYDNISIKEHTFLDMKISHQTITLKDSIHLKIVL